MEVWKLLTWFVIYNSPVFAIHLILIFDSLQDREAPLAQQNVAQQNAALPEVAHPTCPPKHHLVYIKTHKTGSCTVTNLLYR